MINKKRILLGTVCISPSDALAQGSHAGVHLLCLRLRLASRSEPAFETASGGNHTAPLSIRQTAALFNNDSRMINLKTVFILLPFSGSVKENENHFQKEGPALRGAERGFL
jgi:hypothetical protein